MREKERGRERERKRERERERKRERDRTPSELLSWPCANLSYISITFSFDSLNSACYDLNILYRSF